MATLDDIDIAIDNVDVDEMIADRVTTPDAISLTSAVARVNDVASDGGSVGEVTRLVEADGTLAAQVMRLARSAAYTGIIGEKISLPYAVMRLGVQGVRGVCLTAAMSKVALKPGPLLPMRQKVWRECLASALTCQALAGPQRISLDAAYLLGLFHDYGKIVALSVVEGGLLNPQLEGDEPFWASVMERHHCDVGWIMADAWRLPTPIPDVTATHHQPSPVGEVPLRDIVGIADRVVSAASARGWVISAAEIAAMPGVSSQDEAMAIRIAIAKHPYFLTALA